MVLVGHGDGSFVSLAASKDITRPTPFFSVFRNYRSQFTLTSVLANVPGVHIAVISRNQEQTPESQLIIRRRSQDVVAYNRFFQVSATGLMSYADLDSEKTPNPFVTAVTEARQEIADCLKLSEDEFKLIGIALRWEDFLPIFFGYAETPHLVREIFGDFRRDAYEGTLYAIPFDPRSVLEHIVRERWEPVSAVAAIASILAFYPREEVEAIAQVLPSKNIRDFFETLGINQKMTI